MHANKEQEEVIRTINGAMLVIAGPGSGKTTTMIRRIKHMIESGIPETTILMVTFTRDAAISMRNKYKNIYGELPKCTFQTLHAMCLHLLKEEGRYQTGDLCEGKEQADFVYQYILSNQIDADSWDLTTKILSEISVIKNSYVNLDEYEAKSCDTEFFLSAYRAYEEWKESMGKLDFDDLMIKCLEMLKTCPKIQQKWQEHYQYIQCDEYQDTNYLQRDILYYLTGKDNNLCVVGDDDQSIYGFRGAKPEVMTEFTEHFKDCKIVKLTTNYRSCQAIVDIADDLIKYNTGRFDKEFVSFRGQNGEDGKAEYIRKNNKTDEMEDILRRIRDKHREGIPYEDIAILVRTNKQVMMPVSSLSKANIPFYTTENVRSIYSHWIFNDIKAYADLSMGNGTLNDVKLVLNHPNRHLDVTKFHIKEFSYPEFRKGIGYLSNAEFWKYEAANKKIREWMNALGPEKITEDSSPAELFQALDGAHNSIHYHSYLVEYTKFRKEDITEYDTIYEELKEDAMRYETVKEWFRYAAYCIKKLREDIAKKDKTGVHIATMHGSKGLEWSTVYIMDCNENIVPHKNSLNTTEEIAEERRLLYVAITRAKDEVYIYNSSPKESRFIKQIRDGMSVNGVKRIPKYPPGKKVSHKRFGTGKVIGYEPNQIIVLFDNNKEIKLSFPDAFTKGFMTYMN